MLKCFLILMSFFKGRQEMIGSEKVNAFMLIKSTSINDGKQQAFEAYSKLSVIELI